MIKKIHYCNNKDFTKAVTEYQKLCRAALRNGDIQPQMPKYIGECILNICNRLTAGKGFNFTSHTYRDEMVADAIERCCYAILKFNPRRTSAGAFGYFTTVAVNSMKKRINDETKQHATMHKFFQAKYVTHDIAGAEPNEHSDKVIGDYEAKLQRKATIKK